MKGIVWNSEEQSSIMSLWSRAFAPQGHDAALLFVFSFSNQFYFDTSVIRLNFTLTIS